MTKYLSLPLALFATTMFLFSGCATKDEHSAEYAYAVNLGKELLPPPPEAQTLMAEAEAAEEAGKLGRATDLYKKVAADYEDTSLAPEALYRAGLLYKKRHQYSKAFDQFSAILANYPSYSRFNEVINEEFEIASSLMEGKRPYYFGVIPGFKNYKEAIKFFRGVVDNAPSSEYAPVALMNIALISAKHGKDTDAIDALEQLIDDYPSSILAPGAHIQLADLYASLVQGPAYDQGATKEAILYYQDFLTLYPNNDRVPEVEAKLKKMRDIEARNRKEIGDFYYARRNNPEAARIFYQEAITTAPESKAAAESEQMIVAKLNKGVPARRTWVDFVLGRYKRKTLKEYQEDEAVEHYETEEFLLRSTEGLVAEGDDTEWVEESFAPDQVDEFETIESTNPFDPLDPLDPAFNEFPIDPLPTDNIDPNEPIGDNWEGEHRF